MKFVRLVIFSCLWLSFTAPNFAQQPNLVAQINRPTLRLGSRGVIVAELQAALKLLGYYQGKVDGLYNESTAIAVSHFQEAAGLRADGIVGNSTWASLFPAVSAPNSGSVSSIPTSTPTSIPVLTPTPAPTPAPTPKPTQPRAENLPTLKEGMEGENVKLLQRRLRSLGFYSGVVDGIFGRQTLEAVIKAQTSFGLDGDGIVGLQTWRRILAN